MDGETLQKTAAYKLVRKKMNASDELVNSLPAKTITLSAIQSYSFHVLPIQYPTKVPREKDTPYNIKHWARQHSTSVNYEQT
jgi:hypothetical protein